MSFLDAWLHGEGSFIGVIMMGVKSIFFRLLIFRLLTSHEVTPESETITTSPEHLFLMLIKNQTHNFCCRQVVSVPILARTSTGRVGLRNAAVREFTCSGEGRQSRFWGVSASSTTTRFVLSFLLVMIIYFPACRC